MKKLICYYMTTDVRANDFINISFLIKQNNTFPFIKNIFNKDTQYSIC